jgi:nitrogen fixation protein FixH
MKILIFIVVVIVIAVIVGTIYIGSKTFDGTVVDKPYEIGIKYDKIQKALKDFNVSVENEILKRGKNTFIFSITSETKDTQNLSNILVIITKPTTSKYDRSFNTVRLPNGKYQAEIELPHKGQWEIRVVFNVDSEELTYPFLYNVQ